jgi:hypothetical protein
VYLAFSRGYKELDFWLKECIMCSVTLTKGANIMQAQKIKAGSIVRILGEHGPVTCTILQAEGIVFTPYNRKRSVPGVTASTSNCSKFTAARSEIVRVISY